MVSNSTCRLWLAYNSAIHVQSEFTIWSHFPSVLWHCRFGNRKGIRSLVWLSPCVDCVWMLICCWWRFDWSFACLIAPVVTTNSVVDKIWNGNVLIPAYVGCPGKWPLNFFYYLVKCEWTMWHWSLYEVVQMCWVLLLASLYVIHTSCCYWYTGLDVCW